MLLQRLEGAYSEGIGHEEVQDNHGSEGLKTDDVPHTHNHDVRLRHNSHHRGITTINGCPSNTGASDGHTIVDKTRHYKLCNPVHKLPICR